MNLLLGHWAGEKDGTRYEEIWLPTMGPSALGAFRQIKADGSELYELQLLKVEPGETTLYLRHFDGNFVGWESKESPMKFKLSFYDSKRLVFKNAGPGKLREIEYELRNDTLFARLTGEQGANFAIFEYNRVLS